MPRHREASPGVARDIAKRYATPPRPLAKGSLTRKRSADRARARAMDEVLAAREVDVEAGEATVVIGGLIDEGRTLRANVTFDAGLLGAIDAAAKERGKT